MKFKQFVKNIFTVNIWLKIGMLVLAFFLAVAVAAVEGGMDDKTTDNEQTGETAIVSEWDS